MLIQLLASESGAFGSQQQLLQKHDSEDRGSTEMRAQPADNNFFFNVEKTKKNCARASPVLIILYRWPRRLKDASTSSES